MIFRPYFHKNQKFTHEDVAAARPAVSYFTSTQLSTIYNYPTPNLATKMVIGVISLGGGLVGTVSAAGVLTGGDVQAHWTYLGISSANHPKVVIVTLGGATNSPVPSDGATIENTIDVETIGAMYPSANLTIILYLAPNTLNAFTTLLNAVATPITVNSQVYKPSVVSCSWGAPEVYFSSSQISGVNSQLQALAGAGVTMTAATGDNGSSDGIAGTNVDFPSCCPYALACGGTNLVCPTYTYAGAGTVERAWTSGGGGISTKYSKPSYQSALPGTGRNTPDVALVADPSTGVVYTIGGILEVIGGTSIVSPAVAAFIALVNANLFITPLLYSAPSSNFHDVLTGSNGAYTSKTGYDNTTGLGSILGTSLAAQILGTAVQVTGVSLNQSSFSVTVGSTYALTATVSPTNASNQLVSYSSSNNSIATVNATTGVVTGVAAGNATITVTTVSGGFTATSVATVQQQNPIVPTSITVSPASVNVNVNRTTTLNATVLPSNAANKSVTWSSANTAIARVNSTTGVVTGVANGTVAITATTVSGGLQAQSTVTVLTPVSGIQVTPTSVTVAVGVNAQLVATVQPATASNKTVSWLSQNVSIATVNSSGQVRGVRRGTTTVLATAGAYSASIRVSVS
jgi:uncharacterized protein YjdB